MAKKKAKVEFYEVKLGRTMVLWIASGVFSKVRFRLKPTRIRNPYIHLSPSLICFLFVCLCLMDSVSLVINNKASKVKFSCIIYLEEEEAI